MSKTNPKKQVFADLLRSREGRGTQTPGQLETELTSTPQNPGGTETNTPTNTELNKPVDTELQKTSPESPASKQVVKSTFDLNKQLHKFLKMQSAMTGKPMVEIVEEAIQEWRTSRGLELPKQ